MLSNWPTIFVALLLESFFISCVLTVLMRKLSLRWGAVDHPGPRKMHQDPIPVLGGLAIFLTFTGVILLDLILLRQSGALGFEWVHDHVQVFLGSHMWRPLLAVLCGGLVIVLLGVIDDLRPLDPVPKLTGQTLAALILVCSGIRLDLFIEPILVGLPFFNQLETATFHQLSVVVSSFITILWILLIVNAMNFLDNMDGLSAGIAIISALSFFACIVPHQEYFICALLMVFVGSVAGFLVHNVNPAKIFMGDSGSMFCGYILATVAVLGTFYTVELPSRAVIVAPILALSVPLFDIITVICIRWRKGESIMKGDERHFSHRLVDLGLSPRQAVHFIYLIAIITGFGGALLLQVSDFATVVIIAQAVAVFAFIVLLIKVKRRG